MSDSEYMPLGRSGGPYRAPGTPPARAVALLGVGMLCGYFLLDLVQPQSSSRRVAAAASDALVTVVARDEGAEQRMRAAAAVARQAEPAAGQGESESTLLDPKALRELRQALKAAVAEAHASGPGTDPLALLAHRLLQRPAADRPTTAAAPAATNVAAGGGGGGGGGGASLPPTGGLPSKLPTAAMWPPRFTRGGGVRSGFESLGRLEPYRGGDLEQPGELARAAKARSFNGELVLTYGNEAGTAWIANLVFSLRAVGIEHFLVIVMDDEHCAELMKPPWRISCAWSSWDFGKSRESGRGCRRPGELRRLWYSRHHYMSRVIGELNLNVAVVDGDISVQRDFYPLLKAPPLREHNLIYTLDHQHTCGDLNVGFAYCQNCASGGRAQWAIDEGLRREGYFCAGEPGEFDGANARFWARSDGAGVTAGPHRWVEWTTARDQKLYSDVVGGSCCGAPQHRLLFPGTYKQVGDSYAFMRQWGSHAGCMTMAAAGGGASGLQTWWHELLMGGNASDGYARAGGPRETVAIATGSLASGWHGTGEGELAGWSGHWSERPPAVAHFVGGGPAGGKVEIMQGLGWWRYEADVAAHAIAEATNKTAGYALPRSFFWPATRRGVLVLAGPAARIDTATSAEYVSAYNERRRWLLRLAVLLQRTAVDPRAPCDAPWVVSDTRTGHRGRGYRGRWYTPGWPWPFDGGVGIVGSKCRYGEAEPNTTGATADCCAPIFGKVAGVRCYETAHPAIVETYLATTYARRTQSAELPLADLMVGGEVDAGKLRAVRGRYEQQVLWVRPPLPLPPLRGLSTSDRAAVQRFASKECLTALKGSL